MKRHPALRALSDDHHGTLVQALRLKRAPDDDAETQQVLARAFLEFWHEHANPHFREEDEALLPFFASWGDVNHEAVRQMQREHILIRRDVALLQGELDAASTCSADFLHALGAQLEAHVRLEERIVFPLIEAALPAAALDELPQVLAAWQNANKERS